MKSNTYDNPRDEAIAGLEENITKTQAYLHFITQREPSNKTKQKHEARAIENLKRAVAFLRRCPPNGTPAPGGQQQ